MTKALPADLDCRTLDENRSIEEGEFPAINEGNSKFTDELHNNEESSERSAQCTVMQFLIINEPITQAVAQKLETIVPDMKQSKKDATAYLSSLSVHLYPSALEAWPGFSDWPGSLYKSIAFDILHVMDLGLPRIIPDNAHLVFARQKYSQNGSKVPLIRVISQRIIDPPPRCR